MKRISGLFFCLLLAVSVIGQSKVQIGLYAEGGLFFPSETTHGALKLKNGFGFGGGLYAAASLTEKLSVSGGVGYRYKENQKLYDESYGLGLDGNYPPYGYGGYNPYGYSPYGYGYGYDPGSNYTYESVNQWDVFQQHYIVVPLKLKYTVWKQLFIEAGAEAAWLENYKHVDEDIELDWIVGVGWRIWQLECSVNYINGFKDQSMGDIDGYEEELGQTYRNHMLTINLSYSLLNLLKGE